MPVKTKQPLQKEYRWHPPRAVITVQGSRAGSEQAPSAPSCARGGGCHRQPWGASTPGAHGLQELTSPGEPTVVCSSGGPSGSVCCYLLTWSCFSSAGMEEQRDVCGAEPCLQPPRKSIRSIRGFLCQEHHQISSVGEQAGASHPFFLFLFFAPASLCAFRGSKPQPSSSPHSCGHRLIAHPAAAGCPHTGAPLPIITINDVCTLWQVSEGAAPESAIWNTLLDDGECTCTAAVCAEQHPHPVPCRGTLAEPPSAV